MKLNYPRTFLLGFGFFGISVIWGTYNLFVPVFLSEKFGISIGLIGLFSTLAAIAGPIINGLIIQLSGDNYNLMWIIAPLFMLIALYQMLGVRRGEAAQVQAPQEQMDQEAAA